MASLSLKTVRVQCALTSVIVCFSASVATATIPWSNAVGDAGQFTWGNGHNNTGLFGDPTVSGNGFSFDAVQGFRADGGAGVGDGATDFAFADVTATGMGMIDMIIVREWGTWSVGVSNPTSDFVVQADVSTTQFTPSAGVTQLDIDNEYLEFLPDGTWYAEGHLVPQQGAFSHAWVKVTNTIQVNGSAPDGSFIEKTGMQIIVPEPATAWVVVMGVVACACRRPRR